VMVMTSSHHAAAGRLGAAILHSRYDSELLTRNARLAFDEKWPRIVDPEGQLSPTERRRRAGHARRAFYLRLSRLGVQARRRRREARNGGTG